MRSAIFPLKIAPTIPPIVTIEPKTEYCNLYRKTKKKTIKQGIDRVLASLVKEIKT